MKNLMPIMLLLVAGGIVWVSVLPQYDRVQELRAEQEEYEDANQKSIELKDRWTVLEKKYEEFTDSQLQALNVMMPKDADNVRLIVDIKEIADENGVVIQNIDERESLQGDLSDKYKVHSVTLTINSTYNRFNDFLSGLEESLRILDVTRITFDSSEGNVHEFTVTLNAYWMK